MLGDPGRTSYPILTKMRHQQVQKTEASVRCVVRWWQIEGQMCSSHVRCTEQNLQRTVTSLPRGTRRQVGLVSSGPVISHSRPQKPRDGQTGHAPSEAGKPENDSRGPGSLQVSESRSLN